MEKKNEIEVLIGGQVYKLTADESEEYIQKLASYLNKKIAAIYKNKKNPTINQQISSLYLAINITDDYLKAIEKYEKKELEIEAFSEEYLRIEEENQNLKNRNEMLEAEIKSLYKELHEAKKELNEFIETFENKN